MNVARMHMEPGTAVSSRRHEELRGVARRFVAQAFFGEILKQMRESPFKSELFSGGRGGEAFRSMLDFQLADRMARSSGRRLADSIVRHIEGARGRGEEGEGGVMRANQDWVDVGRKARSDVSATR